MIRFLADENFNGIIIRGFLRRQPLIDLLTAREVGLGGETTRRYCNGPRSNTVSFSPTTRGHLPVSLTRVSQRDCR